MMLERSLSLGTVTEILLSGTHTVQWKSLYNKQNTSKYGPAWVQASFSFKFYPGQRQLLQSSLTVNFLA